MSCSITATTSLALHTPVQSDGQAQAVVLVHHAAPDPVTARKDDAPAAIQAAIVKVAELSSVSGGGGLIHTTSG